MNFDKPLLDPDAFLQQKQPRGKLRRQAKLIQRLLGKGFSSYMVWRYLVEVHGLDVSASTVLRFTRKLRPGGDDDVQAPAQGHNMETIASVPADAVVSPINAYSAPTTNEDLNGSSVNIPLAGVSTTVPVAKPVIAEISARELNDDENRPVFEPQISEPSSTISNESTLTVPRPGLDRNDSRSTGNRELERALRFPGSGAARGGNTKVDSRGPQEGAPGNVIKTFSASTPAARQRLRDFHRELKDQGEGN